MSSDQESAQEPQEAPPTQKTPEPKPRIPVEEESEMTVSKGLRELKLLDKRITKATNVGGELPVLFVSAVRGQDKMIVHGQIPTEDATKLFKSNLQSARDLILRRSKIKAAIVNSNAKTPVTIGGKKMSVAAAIERKISISYDKQLLGSLQSTLSSMNTWMESRNLEVEKQLARIVESNASSENPALVEAVEAITKAHRDEHEVNIFDPIKIRTVISEMDEEIDAFEAEVDLALTESNARTLIQLR